jgi:hypothetical protein
MTEHEAMIDSLILKWKRLIQWLADERLAKERRDIKSR